MDNVFDYDNLILNEKIFGLEIIDGKVRVLEVKGTGSKYSISGFGEARMKPASIQDGIIIDSEDVANAIREARENATPNKIKKRFASVLLPDSKIFIRVIRFPSKMNKDEIREAVEWKAKDLIAMPLDKVYWDWHRIISEGANEVEVIISAVEKECADSFTKTLKLLNITPLYYDVSGNAASRFLFQNKFPQKKALLVRIDQDSVTLSLYLNGGVRYQKIVKDVIKGGYGVLVEYAASQLRLDAEKAKMMIFSPDKLNNEQKLLLKEFFEAKFDHWYAEIDQILDYFYQTVYSKTKSEVMTPPKKVEEEKKVQEIVQPESNVKPIPEGVKEVKVESPDKGKEAVKPLKQVTVDGKEDIEIYFYGPGARMVYLEDFFIQKGLNVKTELSTGIDISSIKDYISKEGFHTNLVLLGMSLRNIGIFRELRDINLIPKNIKSKYLQISVYSSLYQYLKIIFWNTYIIGVILVFAFLLSLVYKNSAESELESVQNISESPANIQMRERIIELNDTALRLNALLDTQLDWDTFYEKLSRIRGSGILYKNLLITEDEETWKGVAGENAGTSQKDIFYLVISGTSDTRDDLQRFAFNLQNLEYISDVRMPFSNFETNKNIEFTIYAYIHKENLVRNQEETKSSE